MARPHQTLLDLAADRPLSPVTDSAELVISAAEHGMTGLLWSAVGAAPGMLAATAAEELLACDLVVRRRHAELWVVLHEVAEVAAGVGVDLATLKGVTTEARWYDRIGDRPCVDLDLLLGPSDLDRVDDLIAAVQPDHGLVGHVARLARAGRLQSVDLRWHDLPVDLHLDPWKLGIRSRAAAAVWDGTTQLDTTNGGRVRVLAPEAVLVGLALHVTKDRFRRLLGLVDLDRIVRHGVDWAVVERLAALDGLTDAVSLALGAVGEVTGSPNGLRAAGRARSRLWRVAWAPRIRLAGDDGVSRYRWRQHLLPAFARARWAEAAANLGRRAVPDETLLRYQRPEVRGSYAWQLTGGRLLSARADRHERIRAESP